MLLVVTGVLYMTQLLDSQILFPTDKANCKLMYKLKINDKKEN